MEVARIGVLANPPIDPPSGLRRYLGFAKLSPATLRAIALVVDSDDGFRARVAAEVNQDDVGPAGWLWLTRPQGWSDGVARLQEDADAAAGAAAAARSERNARRKLKAARTATDKAEAKARARAAELDEVRAHLADERARRSAAEAELDKLRTELQRAHQERARAVQELKDAEARLAARAAEADQALARMRELETEMESGGALPMGEDTTSEITSHAVGSVDPSAFTQALQATAEGVHTLSQALGNLAALLEQARGTAGAPTVGRAPRQASGQRPDDVDATVAPHAAPQAVRNSRQPAAPRLPVTLPGGVADNSVEAAAFLLKTPRVLVLVDGYNVSMCGWPELRIAEQRGRLLSALDETAARSGADVEVIFDGTDVEPAIGLQTASRGVRQRFSPPDIEADDELLDLLAQTPASRPTVVVSSDNRVREGARRHGANLVHARQLLDLLRR